MVVADPSPQPAQARRPLGSGGPKAGIAIRPVKLKQQSPLQPRFWGSAKGPANPKMMLFGFLE